MAKFKPGDKVLVRQSPLGWTKFDPPKEDEVLYMLSYLPEELHYVELKYTGIVNTEHVIHKE